MNVSKLNNTTIVEDVDVDKRLNDHFLSMYLKVMSRKRCEAQLKFMKADIEATYEEEMIQCSKYKHALERTATVSTTDELLKFLKGSRNALTSLADVSEDVTNVMSPLRNEFEKILDQLPLNGFLALSPNQQLAMIKKLDGCDAFFLKYHKHFNEDFYVRSILAEYLQRALPSDSPLRKEKCDSLLADINKALVKRCAQVSAKAAKKYSRRT